MSLLMQLHMTYFSCAICRCYDRSVELVLFYKGWMVSVCMCVAL
jgi:hypothetical protein